MAYQRKAEMVPMLFLQKQFCLFPLYFHKQEEIFF